MNKNNCTAASILCSQPSAVAFLRGSSEYPNVTAVVRFYQTNSGVLVYTEANGLPRLTNAIVFEKRKKPTIIPCAQVTMPEGVDSFC